MRKEEKIVYGLVALALVLVVGVMMLRAFRDYNDFKNHRAYFRQPGPNQKIEAWMPLGFISKRYDIKKENLVKELNLSDFLLNERLTLDQICAKNKLNCTKVLEDLNSMAGR